MSTTKQDRAKLPVSRAKTVYGLLSEVIRLTDEEPKRMRMEMWLDRNREVVKLFGDKAPACGTIGCIGGWMETLTGIDASWFGDRFGFTGDMADALFYDIDLMDDPNQGTRSHARKVIAHIKRFQKRHEKVLRATKVPRHTPRKAS